MDEVQKFISENQHQFGYIMQEASRQWIKKDPIGALTVGQCAGTIKANGAYIQLLDKVERYEKALKFYSNNAHYEPFREEDLDRSDAFSLIDLDAGETAKDALGK